MRSLTQIISFVVWSIGCLRYGFSHVLRRVVQRVIDCSARGVWHVGRVVRDIWHVGRVDWGVWHVGRVVGHSLVRRFWLILRDFRRRYRCRLIRCVRPGQLVLRSHGLLWLFKAPIVVHDHLVVGDLSKKVIE